MMDIGRSCRHNVFRKPKKLYFHRNTLCRLKFYGKNFCAYKSFFVRFLENLLLLDPQDLPHYFSQKNFASAIIELSSLSILNGFTITYSQLVCFV